MFGILCFPLNETRSIAQGGKKQRIFRGRIFCGRDSFGRASTLPQLEFRPQAVGWTNRDEPPKGETTTGVAPFTAG